MNSQPTHIFTKSLLLAAVFSITAATGAITGSAILGQQYALFAAAQEMTTTTTDTSTTTANASGTTAADGTTGGNQLAGIIASLQLAPDRLAPEWVTAGYWELESDMPLFGVTNETDPTVTRLDGVVEMTRLADGTDLHTHRLSDFQQSDIVFMAENTTTINGTMTVTLEEGPIENVPVFITLQNNLLSIAMDPEATHEHFGPTPISGMILAPEHLQQISNLLAPTSEEEEEGGGGGTGTAGQ